MRPTHLHVATSIGLVLGELASGNADLYRLCLFDVNWPGISDGYPHVATSIYLVLGECPPSTAGLHRPCLFDVNWPSYVRIWHFVSSLRWVDIPLGSGKQLSFHCLVIKIESFESLPFVWSADTGVRITMQSRRSLEAACSHCQIDTLIQNSLFWNFRKSS